MLAASTIALGMDPWRLPTALGTLAELFRVHDASWAQCLAKAVLKRALRKGRFVRKEQARRRRLKDRPMASRGGVREDARTKIQRRQLAREQEAVHLKSILEQHPEFWPA